MSRPRRLAPRAQLAVDAALVLWTAAWLWMGIAVAHEIRGVADLSDTAGEVGRAITGVGGTLRDLPVIGGQMSRPADEIQRAGENTITSAKSARASARHVGVLLGIAIALIPSRLRRVSADPVSDLHNGRHAALADAELEWFGVRARERVLR